VWKLLLIGSCNGYVVGRVCISLRRNVLDLSNTTTTGSMRQVKGSVELGLDRVSSIGHKTGKPA
jgi:hypothetical protein